MVVSCEICFKRVAGDNGVCDVCNSAPPGRKVMKVVEGKESGVYVAAFHTSDEANRACKALNYFLARAKEVCDTIKIERYYTM